MDKETVCALVRHAVAVLAVGVTVNGYTVTGSDAQQLGGLAVTLIVVAWSIAQKKGCLPA